MQITIVQNPFHKDRPAWQDELGRVGTKIDGENTIWWYDVVVDIGRKYGILDEVTMVIDQPFNNQDQYVTL